MTKFIQEEIKHLLSQRVGIRLVSPSDCAVMAKAITAQSEGDTRRIPTLCYRKGLEYVWCRLLTVQ